MEAISLLLPLFFLPGADALQPVDIYTDGELLMTESSSGEGRAVVEGDVATVHFVLQADGGKELANTALRGMPFSVAIPGTESPSALVETLKGMKVGGIRTMFFPSDRPWPAHDSFPSKHAQLVLTVRLVALNRPPKP